MNHVGAGLLKKNNEKKKKIEKQLNPHYNPQERVLCVQKLTRATHFWRDLYK